METPGASSAPYGYAEFRKTLWNTTDRIRYMRDGSVEQQLLVDGATVPTMSGGIDLDLLEYAHWARSIRGLSENTVRVRVDLLARLHTYVGVPLRQVEPGHLRRFERMAIAGRSPETRRAYTCHCRAFFRWAKRTGLISEDPSEVLTIPRVPRHLPRPIEEDDLALALAAARPKMRAILTLASYAGLRAIEIAGLEWQDLRREPDGSAFLYIRKSKADKQRTVEIGQVVVRALQAYGVKRKGPMFLGLEGRPIDPKSVSRSANKFLATHGVDATLHQLRHRYGSTAYALTRDLRLVQEQLGHSSPATTQIYTRTAPEAAARLVAALDLLALPGQRAPSDDRRTGPDPARTA